MGLNQLEVIERRWPEISKQLSSANEVSVEVVENTPCKTLLVDGIHLSSCYDRTKEAQLQAQLIPDGSASAWVYGIGVGDLPSVLLSRPQIEKVHIVILNLAIFRQVVNHFDLSSWLCDERVELVLASSQKRMNAPFCSAPSCLKLAEESAARIRDMVVLELDSAYINSRFQNNEKIIQQINDNASQVAKDADVSELFASRKGDEVYIAAAGPTLSNHFELLKRLKQEGKFIIGADAVVKPLAIEGIYPDLVISIDEIRDHLMALFDLDLSVFQRSPLVYFPVVHQDVLTKWPGPRYVAYSHSIVYEELSKRHPKQRLFASGSVLHSAVDLAVKMGVSKIHLLGADFAYPSGHSHVKNAVFNQSVEMLAEGDWVISGEGKRVVTTRNLRGYLRDLEQYIDAHPEVDFINHGKVGAKIEGTRFPEETEHE